MSTSDSQCEATLLKRIAEGDDVAARRLLLPHVVYLSQYVKAEYPNLGNGVSSVEDVIQDALADAFRNISKFDPSQASVRTWLTTIAKRRAADAVRSQQRIKRGGKNHQVVQRSDDEPLHQLVDLLAADSHTASRSVMRHEAVQAVRDALQALPSDHRQAVQLNLLEGKTLDETAADMNCSRDTVRGLIYRAKKKLAGVLGSLSKYR